MKDTWEDLLFAVIFAVIFFVIGLAFGVTLTVREAQKRVCIERGIDNFKCNF